MLSKISAGDSVDQNDVDLLIDLIQNGEFVDASERRYLRSVLLFWNSTAKLPPIPEKESYEQEIDSETLIKRRQAKPEQVKPTFFDKLNWRK